MEPVIINTILAAFIFSTEEGMMQLKSLALSVLYRNKSLSTERILDE
jgi:hypothetical protein